MFNPVYNKLTLWFNRLEDDMYKVFLLVQSLRSVIDKYITRKNSVFLHTLEERSCSIISFTINDFKQFYNEIDCTSEWRLSLNFWDCSSTWKRGGRKGTFVYVASFHERWFILHVTHGLRQLAHVFIHKWTGHNERDKCWHLNLWFVFSDIFFPLWNSPPVPSTVVNCVSS